MEGAFDFFTFLFEHTHTVTDLEKPQGTNESLDQVLCAKDQRDNSRNTFVTSAMALVCTDDYRSAACNRDSLCFRAHQDQCGQTPHRFVQIRGDILVLVGVLTVQLDRTQHSQV